MYGAGGMHLEWAVDLASCDPMNNSTKLQASSEYQ